MAHKEELQEKGNVKLVHLDILRTDEHAEWKANPQLVGDALKKPRTPESLRPIGPEHCLDSSHLHPNWEACESRYAPHSAVLLCGREPYDGGIAVAKVSLRLG